MDISPTAEFKHSAAKSKPGQGSKRRSTTWTETEEADQEAEREIAGMRDCDGATVTEGFCPVTGFDIKGTRGNDGYTGYFWSQRRPFDQIKYERKLEKMKNQKTTIRKTERNAKSESGKK